MPAEFDPIDILQVLEEHNVRFVVVGGFAAWMQGAPVVTADVDIVYEVTAENIAALVAALTALSAFYRHQMGRRIQPDAAGLASTVAAGHHLLETRSGNLDVLRTASGIGYADLSTDTIAFEIEGSTAHFATLERVIHMKEIAGRPKDIAALPTLRAALAQARDTDER